MSDKVNEADIPTFRFFALSFLSINCLAHASCEKFLGKGGFAKCYELVSTQNEQMFAGKIVSKWMLNAKNQRAKMTQEIEIHRSLQHEHVVGFLDYFEDHNFVYIVLELCSKRSLMELHKRRRAITEPEARYYTHQVCLGTQYLHRRKIIHRDLKLGNLFLNEHMKVKIGDFGLATKLDYDGERKKTLCGTPNYIAPEMLAKRGHSYEVDIWAIGCILYTLLVGKPPFETQSLKDTYAKIRKNEYHIPSKMSNPARQFVRRLLAAEPAQRPDINSCLTYEFFTSGYMPEALPVSCLTMAPKFPSTTQLPSMQQQQSQPLAEYNRGARQLLSPKEQVRQDILHAPMRPLDTVPENERYKTSSANVGVVQPQSLKPSRSDAQMLRGEDGEYYQNVPAEAPRLIDDVPQDFWLSDLRMQLAQVVNIEPSKQAAESDEDALEPKDQPMYWVSKWVDYSDKYGLGYQLCDNSVGVLFNDLTKMVLDEHGHNLQYIDRENKECFYTLNMYPRELQKKITLVKYFRTYMIEHLLKAGADLEVRAGDELARLPCLRTWFRTRSAIVLHLTSGTLQINFFNDHTKVIICPLMKAVTYIDAERNFRTLSFAKIIEYGCTREVFSRIKYAYTMIERLLSTGQRSVAGGQLVSTAGRSVGMTPSRSSQNV